MNFLFCRIWKIKLEKMCTQFFFLPPPLASNNKESIFRFIFLSLVLYLWRRWGRWKAAKTQRIRGYLFFFVNNCHAIDWVPWSPAACRQTAVSAKISLVLQEPLKSWWVEYKAEYKNSLPGLDSTELLFKLKHFFFLSTYSRGATLVMLAGPFFPSHGGCRVFHWNSFFFPLRSIIAIRMQGIWLSTLLNLFSPLKKTFFSPPFIAH